MICRIVILVAALLRTNAARAEFTVAVEIPLDTSEVPSDLEPPRMVTGNLNGDGKIDWVFTHGTRIVIDYDGDRRRDKILTLSGNVRDHTGRMIDDNSWIPPGKFVRWGLARDIIGDEREEYITWSHSKLIVGANNASFTAGSIPSFRSNREYRLRAVNHRFRSTTFFDYRAEQ